MTTFFTVVVNSTCDYMSKNTTQTCLSISFRFRFVVDDLNVLSNVTSRILGYYVVGIKFSSNCTYKFSYPQAMW